MGFVILNRVSYKKLRIIITVFVTFIWLFPYDLGNNFFWIGQLASLALSGYFLINYFSKVHFKLLKSDGIFKWLLLYGVTTIIPSIISLKAADIIVQIIFTINILGMFAYFEISCKKNCKDTIIGVVLITLFYFVKDIQLLNLIGVGDFWNVPTYFTGGKFDVIYNLILALFAIYIFCFFDKKSNFKTIVYILFLSTAIIYCFRFDCMTGFLGIVGGLICFRIFLAVKKNVSNLSIFFIFLICGIAPLFMEAVLSINFVNSFIVNILGRTASLTGRLNIYTNLIDVISHSLLFGHGRSSTYSMQMIQYSNMQNGLMQITYLYGLIGLLAICKLIYEYLKTVVNSSRRNAIIAIFICFAICSISEITYGYTEYYYYLALSYALSKHLTHFHTSSFSRSQKKLKF